MESMDGIASPSIAWLGNYDSWQEYRCWVIRLNALAKGGVSAFRSGKLQRHGSDVARKISRLKGNSRILNFSASSLESEEMVVDTCLEL